MTWIRVLIGALLAACVVGWGLAITEGVQAARYRRTAKRAQLELKQTQSATGLLSELAQRIRETQRRTVELELERTDLQAHVDDLRRELQKPEPAGPVQ